MEVPPIRLKCDGREWLADSVGAADVVAFERQYKVSGVKLEGEEPFVEWIAFVAYRSLVRSGVTDLPEWDHFIEHFDEVRILGDSEPSEAGDDPGEAGGEVPQVTTSPSSPSKPESRLAS